MKSVILLYVMVVLRDHYKNSLRHIKPTPKTKEKEEVFLFVFFFLECSDCRNHHGMCSLCTVK